MNQVFLEWSQGVGCASCFEFKIWVLDRCFEDSFIHELTEENVSLLVSCIRQCYKFVLMIFDIDLVHDVRTKV